MYDDEHAISQLVLRFADALNRRDDSAFAALWAPRATWRIAAPADFSATGTPVELAAAVRGRFTRWRTFVQTVHGTLAEVDGDIAHARSHLSELGVPCDGPGGYYNLGVYRDRLLRTERGWRFVSREYTYLYLDTSPLPGQAFAAPA